MASALRTIGVSIPVPEPYGSQLRRWRASFGDPLADAVPPHITLLPPTEVDESMLGEIDRHLAGVAGECEPFRIQLRGTATFRPVSPVVFVVVAEGLSFCEQLEALVRQGPLMRDLHFSYHPHVTVAHHLPDDVLNEAFEKLADYRSEFVVRRFSLYEHGADLVWRPRRDFVLNGTSASPSPADPGVQPGG